eukprot:3574417-Alexandrium_andersonii.AAC.1
MQPAQAVVASNWASPDAASQTRRWSSTAVAAKPLAGHRLGKGNLAALRQKKPSATPRPGR